MKSWILHRRLVLSGPEKATLENTLVEDTNLLVRIDARELQCLFVYMEGWIGNL